MNKLDFNKNVNLLEVSLNKNIIKSESAITNQFQNWLSLSEKITSFNLVYISFCLFSWPSTEPPPILAPQNKVFLTLCVILQLYVFGHFGGYFAILFYFVLKERFIHVEGEGWRRFRDVSTELGFVFKVNRDWEWILTLLVCYSYLLTGQLILKLMHSFS